MWGNNVKYESPKRQSFRINNFSGGLCNILSESRINSSDANDILNIQFEQDGILKKRPGLDVDQNFDWINEHKPDGEDMLNMFQIRVIRNGDDASHELAFLINFSESLLYVNQFRKLAKWLPWKRRTANVPFDGVQVNDKFFFVDGGSYMNFVDLNDLETVPEAEVKLHMVVTPEIGDPNWKPAPKPAIQGVWKNRQMPENNRFMYDWYEPCELEMEDNFKGKNECGELYCTMIEYHKDRIYLTGNVGYPNTTRKPQPNMIYATDIMNPYYVPVGLSLQTPPNEDKITALTTFTDSLVIGRKNDIYALYGNSNRPDSTQLYNMKKLTTHTGIANRNSYNAVFNYLFFVGSDSNLYRMQTTKTESSNLMTSQLNVKLDFTLPPCSHKIADISNAKTGYDSIRNEWHVVIGQLSYVYNFNSMAFTRYDYEAPVRFLQVNNKFYNIDKNAHFCFLNDKKYYDLNLQNYVNHIKDNERIPYKCVWESKNMDFNSPSRVKQIRDTFIIAEIFNSHWSDIRIKYECDYVDVRKDYGVSSEISRWDMAQWDINRFIYKDIFRSLPIMVGRRCKNFKVSIGSGYDYLGSVSQLPGYMITEEGSLFKVIGNPLGDNILTETVDVYGLIDQTTGQTINWQEVGYNGIITQRYLQIDPSYVYEFEVDLRDKDIRVRARTDVFFYDQDKNYLGFKTLNQYSGFIFDPPEEARYIRYCIVDLDDPIALADVISIGCYIHYDKLNNEINYTNGYWLRAPANKYTGKFYTKVYNGQVFQPFKVHEINGLYEFKGYR